MSNMKDVNIFCLLNLMLSVGSLEIHLLENPRIFQTAQRECRNLGQGWELAGGLNLPQNLTDTLILHNISSVWLGFRRRKFSQCRWVNGKVDESTSPHTTDKGCATISLEKTMSRHVCADETAGMLCEVPECPTQIPGEKQCTKVGETFYLFMCNANNWYRARLKCGAVQGQLAILDNNNKISELMKILPEHSHKFTCDFFYVGFHCEDWTFVQNEEIKAVEKDNWDTNEPSDSNHDCVQLAIGRNGKGRWRTADCLTKRHAVCQKCNSSNDIIASTDSNKSQICSNVSAEGVKCEKMSVDSCGKDSTFRLHVLVGVLTSVVCIFCVIAVVLVTKNRKQILMRLKNFRKKPTAPEQVLMPVVGAPVGPHGCEETDNLILEREDLNILHGQRRRTEASQVPNTGRETDDLMQDGENIGSVQL